MFHILRHYFPIRKGLLVVSETILLTLVVFVGMSGHLWTLGETWRIEDDVALRLAHLGLSQRDALWRVLFSSLMVSVLAQIAISFNELYNFRTSSSPYERAARFISSAGTAIVLVLAAVVLLRFWRLERLLEFPTLNLSQRIVVLTFSLMVGFGLLYLWRGLFHLLLRRWNFNERVLVLGSGVAARRLADEVLERPDSGFEIVGMVSGDPWLTAQNGRAEQRARAFAGSGAGAPAQAQAAVAHHELRTLAAQVSGVHAGALEVSEAATLVLERELRESRTAAVGEEIDESLYELVQRLKIDTIAVALEDRRGSLPTAELLRCRLEGVAVEEGDALYERVTGKIPVEAMRPSYLIFNSGFAQNPAAQLAKRSLDVAVALAMLLLAWPLMLLTALAVRLDSPGPILFRQERIGRYGRPFTLMKFRSMRADAEKGTGPVWASENDPRITKVGRFIRKTRLDELPQLLNVLGGSMSIVGPRPERPHFVQDLSKQIPYFTQRHIVKPGLTGWAQINYPYGNSIEDALQKLQFDIFYIKHHSLLFDLSILLNTIKTVVLRRGT